MTQRAQTATKKRPKTAAASSEVADKLRKYRKKRDFKVTPEPASKGRKKAGGDGFVVQKHAASHLHYDFRLELDGVLLSWSVPKGPSLVAGAKRLAVRTEDHPLAYAEFEGIIPKGEYGGGTVIVWDRGRWTPTEDAHTGLKKGHLGFELHGEKLSGRFHLIRTRKKDDKHENWLLFKGKDDKAQSADASSITEARPESVLSGRLLDEVAASRDKVWRAKAKARTQTTAVRPKPAPKADPSDVISLVKQLPVQFPLTNLEKVLYPEQGLRKAELIAYAAAISAWMLPHVAERPLTLVRCPDGRHKHCFYQKHARDVVPDVVQRIAITEERSEQDYMVVNDAMGLVALAQLGALEVHTWVCHADKVERPDQFVFDLDPHESVSFDDVREAAFDVRARLLELELTSFVKTTGGKGLHVVVPVQRKHGWDEHKAFALAFVERMARAEPKRFVVNPRKDLRKGRIFLDYLRNGRGATAVAPYSTRAREGATVAAPLSWDELEAGVDPKSFHVKSMIMRMRELGREPWHDYGSVRQTLTTSMQRAVKRA